MYRFSLPPSANKYWRHYRGRMVVSAEATAYKHLVAMLARCSSPPIRLLTGPVKLEVAVHRERKSGDLDNFLKILIDSLQGIFYANDSQIVEIHASLCENKADPHVEVVVTSCRRLD